MQRRTNAPTAPRIRGHHRGERRTRTAVAFGAAAAVVGSAIGLGGGTVLALATHTPAAATSPATNERSIVTPASRVIGLTVPARSAPPARSTAGLSVVDVVLTPAARNRMAVSARATRAQERAQVGARAGWARAVDGTRISSTYGPRWGRMHAGIDFAGPVGTPVRAMSDGVVTFSGRQSGYGNKIEITHEEGTVAHYGHLDKLRVTPGQRVVAGELIAALGNTGRSTGPHLHLEIRTPDHIPVDPLPWLEARGIVPR